uniref:Venom peptide Htgkr20 n=1 Tax=Hadogenes troglodytes TaxID=1577150 RepID=A0A1B3IJC5_9SCOR|nr:venom peptide Htgkr20 [Hadogenes troglodytes]
MKTLPVIFLCLLVLLAAPSGIWCEESSEEYEYETNDNKDYNEWIQPLHLTGKRRVDVLSTSQRKD